MKHVVMYSGGIGSYTAACRVAQNHVRKGDILTLLFADTMTEAEDLYPFMREGASLIGGQLVELRDGRTIWQVFKDVRFLGNHRLDPCSLHLKREIMRRWLEANCDPAQTVCYLGIDWTEEHRIRRSERYWEPYMVQAPLCEPPYIDRNQMLAMAAQAGLAIPSLYYDGFPHNNCGGGCVKAGMGHWALLLEKRPAAYKLWEDGEQEMREFLGKNVAFLTDRRNHKRVPYTLRQLRIDIENGRRVDKLDIGGCACAVGDVDEDTRIRQAESEALGLQLAL